METLAFLETGGELSAVQIVLLGGGGTVVLLGQSEGPLSRSVGHTTVALSLQRPDFASWNA